ncbi:hypothetical protein ILUMI_02987 [Ignelater luminosus]|uniref:Protease inhibitor n=1 Tax=Ignelater luminosus TaxID=2038154 RepID=A0A8K0DBM1_IGNLU|nr:hypothetical protein ILUMI_02987 [Ignelater luminosus]
MQFIGKAIFYLGIFLNEAHCKEDLQCEEGIMYQLNYCKYCECTAGGVMTFCTLQSCAGLPFYENAKKCNVNTQWMEDCNACM